MPTVTLDKKTVLKLLGKKVSDEILKDRIPMLGTDLESISDTEIVVEIFPNRPDMLSEEGFARALSSFMDIKPGFVKYEIKKENSKVTVKNLPKTWPYAVCVIVRGLKLDDNKLRSIIQLQEKLGVTLLRKRKKGGIGLYPMDKITLPINFTSRPKEKIQFRPLEGKTIMKVNDILVNHPTGREYAHIISGWKNYPIFVDSSDVIMSMPPIINSHDVGKVTKDTKDVFVEATGTDLNILKIALNIMITTLADMGGTIYSLEMDYGTEKFRFPDFTPRKIKLDKNYIERLLGIELNDSKIKELLGNMGIGYKKGNALVPVYRADILHQIDIVEDIAVAYGYENFDEEIPKVATIASESKGTILERKIAEVMTGFGMLECKNYHITSDETLTTKMNVEKQQLIKPENPANIEYNTLRNNILPGLMKILSENTHNEYPQKLFETGDVIHFDKTSTTQTKENAHMSCVIADVNSDFSTIKAILESTLKSLDVKFSLKKAKHSSYIDGRIAEIKINGKNAGYVGEINPQVLNNWNLEIPVLAYEIDLSNL
ncbi:phenylalanine--tRNA ligase subunit beta [archaeon]|nr:phenylalanine--tRNA ligase subunit beta [archaeon]